MLSTAIFAYAASAPVNGYFGGSMFAKFGGRRWIKQMFLSAFAIPSLVCGTAFFINFISIYYHASRAIPFTTMVSECTGLPTLRHSRSWQWRAYASSSSCPSRWWAQCWAEISLARRTTRVG